ncbi:hypothetical protein BH11MYX1_BH11MYX1_01830 [soil metagenome]
MALRHGCDRALGNVRTPVGTDEGVVFAYQVLYSVPDFTGHLT